MDYFSVAYPDQETAQAVYDTLKETVTDITPPFQINANRIFEENGDPVYDANGAYVTEPGMWVFNVRHDEELTGDWIAPPPEHPKSIWA